MANYSISIDAVVRAGPGNYYLRTATSASVRLALFQSWATYTATSTVVRRWTIVRTTGGTAQITQTPQLLDIDSRAADTAGALDFSIDPTDSGQPLWAAAVAQGISGAGNVRWIAHPRFPIIVAVSAFLCLKLASTGVTCSRFWLFAEPCYTPSRPTHRRGIRPGWFHHQDHAVGQHAASVVGRRSDVCEFQMVNMGTWPESAPPPNTAVFSGAAPVAANPIFEYRVTQYA